MALRLGDEAPNFTADTTEGPIDFYFSFRQRLLDNQRKFATAILDAGSSSAPAAKKPAKPTVAKKAAAA